MSIKNELNNLAEKITGVNPNGKTKKEALDYIEQNYNETKYYDFVLDMAMLMTYFSDPTKFGTNVKITNENDVVKMQNLEQAVNKNNNLSVRVSYGIGTNVWYIPVNVSVMDGEFYGIQAEIVNPANLQMYELYIIKDDDDFYICPDIYQLQRVSLG